MPINLNVYADESGIHEEATHCVVAGFIASQLQWRLFEEEWVGLLSEAGLSRFHATKLFGRRASRRRTDEFAETISRHGLFPIGAGTEIAAFNRLSVGERRFVTGAHMRGSKPVTSGAQSQPYYLAFQYLLIEATNRASVDGTVDFIFDRQTVLQAKARQTYEDYSSNLSDETRRKKLGSISFENSAEFPALQAADMLAHLWYSYMTDGLRMSEARHSAMSIVTKRRGELRLFNTERLDELLSGLSAEELEQIRASR